MLKEDKLWNVLKRKVRQYEKERMPKEIKGKHIDVRVSSTIIRRQRIARL